MTRPRLHGCLVALAMACWLVSGSAFAETVSVTGAGGARGANGAPGNPGGAGSDGSDGESATADASAPGEENYATAQGGRGGDGGNGGAGVPAGAEGGAGGHGGNGGDATATAIGSDTGSVRAVASGGAGGFGGREGPVSPLDDDPILAATLGPAGDPGAGGNAAATAQLETDGLSLATGIANASTGAGGDVSATARVVNVGSGGALAVAEVFGGGGGDVAAHAFAANAGSGPVFARAVSNEGPGTGVTTPDVRAEGHSTGGGDVTVAAAATRTGRGDPAEAVVLVDAVQGSTSGTLRLEQAAGLLPSFPIFPLSGVDAVTALTATNPGGGNLEMIVSARGGLGASGRDGGDAVVGDVVGTSSTGADVRIAVEASGGRGGVLLGGQAGSGGGVIQENRSPGKVARPSRIYGASQGGAVSVEARFSGGGGGNSFQFEESARPGSGASISMDNAVDGDTRGDLALSQHAIGGVSGRPVGGEVAAPPSAGSAYSRLTKKTRSDSLFLRSVAEGNGFGGPEGVSGSGVALVHGVNVGGSATVSGFAFGGPANARGNRGGDARFEGRAVTLGDGNAVFVGPDPIAGVSARGGASLPALGGGFTGPGPAANASGGNAYSRSTGIALGDSEVTVVDRAVGGRGGNGVLPSFGPVFFPELPEEVEPPGDGTFGGTVIMAPSIPEFPGSSGDATISMAPIVVAPVVIAPTQERGVSPGVPGGAVPVPAAPVQSVPVGVSGSLVPEGTNAQASASLPGTPGNGGAASSKAYALGAGHSTVRALADARGGETQNAQEPAGRGGDAKAVARAVGRGRVEAIALAIGGNSTAVDAAVDPAGVGGSARARATASGASGFARAAASTGSGLHPQVRAQVESAVGSRRKVVSHAAVGARLHSLAKELGLSGSALITSDPRAHDVSHALAGNSALADRFAEPGAEMLALAAWQGSGGWFGEPRVVGTQLDILLDDVTPGAGLMIGAFGLKSWGGFLGLSFSLERDGIPLFEEVTFDSFDAAAAYFTDTVFDVAAIGEVLRARFEVVLGKKTHFSMKLGFAQVVPEPSTGVLLGLGLLIVAVGRRASR